MTFGSKCFSLAMSCVFPRSGRSPTQKARQSSRSSRTRSRSKEPESPPPQPSPSKSRKKKMATLQVPDGHDDSKSGRGTASSTRRSSTATNMTDIPKPTNVDEMLEAAELYSIQRMEGKRQRPLEYVIW